MPSARHPAMRLVPPLASLVTVIGARSLLSQQAPALARTLGPNVAALIDRSLAVAVCLAAAVLLVRLLDVAVWRRRHPPAPRLLRDLVAVGVWASTTLVVAIAVLELPLMGILTTSGVVVAVLGFALRDVLSSLFAGIALAAERPYRLGDWLEPTPGTIGEVTEIGWLTTRLLTMDRVALVIPNVQLATRSFANYRQAGDGAWRDQITITLGYEVSPARAERILLAAAASVLGAKPADQPPDAQLVACGEHGMTWQLRYWLTGHTQRGELRHAVHTAVLRHLYQSGLGPANRRLDLFHAAMPARALEHGDQIDTLLGRSELFCHLAVDELETLATGARRTRILAGACVVRVDEPGSSLFVVIEGVLDVALTLPGGALRKVRDIGPGGMFGEYSLLTGAPRSATVTARTDSVLLEITKADLEPVLQRSPDLARSMSAILAAREAERPQLANDDGETTPSQYPGERSLLGRIRSFFGLVHQDL